MTSPSSIEPQEKNAHRGRAPEGELIAAREEVEARQVREMFGSIAPRYDLANSFLSLGIHKLWRIRLKKHFRGAEQEPVLDVCTGTGDVLVDLERSFNHCIGVDFCFPMMVHGKKRRSSSLFVQGDALSLPFPDDSFGLITVSFGVRNLESVETGLRELRRILKPGGKLLILEFGQPTNFAWRQVFDFYSAFILPTVGGLLTGNRAAYEYLPKTSKEFPCADDFKKVIAACDFRDIAWESLTGGIAYLYSAVK